MKRIAVGSMEAQHAAAALLDRFTESITAALPASRVGDVTLPAVTRGQDSDGGLSKGSDASVPEDTALSVLSDPATRFTFYFVRDRAHRSVRFQELGSALYDRREQLGFGEDVDRTSIGERLRTHHLPALSRQGLLHLDDEAKTVRYVRRDGIDAALDAQSAYDPNVLWSRS